MRTDIVLGTQRYATIVPKMWCSSDSFPVTPAAVACQVQDLEVCRDQFVILVTRLLGQRELYQAAFPERLAEIETLNSKDVARLA